MELTRRRFLECAAGSALAVAVLPRAARPLDRRRSRAEWSVECAVLDLDENCCIRESLAGYELALAQLDVRTVRVGARSAPESAALIVPAALRISPDAGRAIRRSLDNGTTVIVESGAGFADAAGADFAAHRDALREELEIHVEPPVSLWPRHPGAGGIPYVDYHWPTAARVRDFSRVVPVVSRDSRDTIIARLTERPVALMRRSGTGTLVFLGSPLGPALRAGDTDAKQWLSAVLAFSRGQSR